MKKSFHNGVQFAWDSTSLSLAQTCPRKYYYSMIREIAPRSTSVHLLFGGIYASALERFYKERAAGRDFDMALRLTVQQAMQDSWTYAECDTCEGHGYVDEPDGSRFEVDCPDCVAGQISVGPKHFDDANKTRPALIRTIVWYLDQFGHEEEGNMSTFHLANGKPAVELSFALEMSEDVVYCGHLDRVVLFGGDKYVMDQKTTKSTISNYYWNQFSPDNQMSGYSWAGQIVLDSPVRGVIIDAAQIAINFSRFERNITTRSRDQLEEWLRNTLDTIHRTQDIAAIAKEEAHWPMNLTACNNYGGCPFRILCSRSPAVRENFIKSDFVSKVWDPLEAR